MKVNCLGFSKREREDWEVQTNTRGPAASSEVHSVTVTSTENLAVLLIVTPVHTPSSILLKQKQVWSNTLHCEKLLEYYKNYNNKLSLLSFECDKV